ncbi:MAG: DUF3604 domain-containing protein [Gammaproteobacteria bacterium]|nr:DUF3604 domain-containing protein [Gammaproteobacteria bacterium]
MNRTIILAIVIASPLASAQTALSPGKDDIPATQKIYSPYVERTVQNQNFAEGLFWGDTHLHTGYSSDSGMIGNKLGPEQAYRFAKGEEVISSTGQRTRLIRPLDFLVISDHAENLGLAPMIAESNAELLKTEYGKKWHDMVKEGEGYEAFREWGGSIFTGDKINSKKMQRTIWDRQIEAAEQHNEPGRFTALIGFEWTSLNTSDTPSNLHRVVIFKDGERKASQVLPFSAFDSQDPEDLWKYMASYEEKVGGSILAIPHNGNLSNGLMFAVERLNGKSIDKEYAETRMRWEPLYEVTQIKGDGEAHPKLSPTDEWADYGTWDKGDIAGVKPKQDDMLQYEYARTALQVGLGVQQKTGANPFKFGMIGSTDAHTSLAATREENYWGKFAGTEPAADRYKHYVIKAFSGDESLSTFAWEEVSSGLAGVWARENTREAIFDAMQRKETYATTGTRITVRFFGGWDYSEDDVYRPDAVSIGYNKGVPMGGDLAKATDTNKAPTFMVGALKDPQGANLDRIQIVKGWVDEDGKRNERIYDVACADRAITEKAQCESTVGNTVDEKNATFLNNIGDAELRAVWTDPDFDAKQHAVYYTRVLEIPTPTWQAYDAKFYGTEMPEQVPLSHQERAYTSPIWYTPGS